MAPEGQPSSGPAGPSSSARPAPPTAPGPRALSTTGRYFSGGASGAQQVGLHAAQRYRLMQELADTEVSVAHLGPRTHQRPTKPTCGMQSRKRVQRGCREPQRAWQRPAWASKGASYTSEQRPRAHRDPAARAAAAGTLPTQLEGAGLCSLAPWKRRLALLRGAGRSRARWTRPPACLGPRCRHLVPQALVLEQRAGLGTRPRPHAGLYVHPRLRGFGTNISPERPPPFSSACRGRPSRRPGVFSGKRQQCGS